jgi:hypothetical protein
MSVDGAQQLHHFLELNRLGALGWLCFPDFPATAARCFLFESFVVVALVRASVGWWFPTLASVGEAAALRSPGFILVTHGAFPFLAGLPSKNAESAQQH